MWPVVPEELEPQSRPHNLMSLVPSTLMLTESTGSRHNGENDSVQPSKPKLSNKVKEWFDYFNNSVTRTAAVLFAGVYMLDDERLEGCDFSEESSLFMCPKLKDRSPFTVLASSRFRNRLLHSLSLPGKRPCTTPHAKGSNPGQAGELDGKHALRLPIAEPTSHSFVATDIFPMNNGHLSTSPSGVGNKANEISGSTPSIGEVEMDGSGVRTDHQREKCSYERLAEDGPSGGSGAQFKSRSQSFNTDTTTSGISSMSSSPSRETLPSAIDTDCVSLNTVISAQTIQNVHSLTPQPYSTPLSIPKSCSASLVPPGSSHTLPRRAQSLKSPSVSTLSSLADCSIYSSSREALGYATLKYSSSHNGCTSPQDALGYATLRRLQHQRIQPSLSHSKAMASPAKDILFANVITMNTGSLDSRLTSRRYQ